MLMFGEVRVRANDLLEPDHFAIIPLIKGTPRAIGRWSTGSWLESDGVHRGGAIGQVTVYPGETLIVHPEVYEFLLWNRVSARVLRATGGVVFTYEKGGYRTLLGERQRPETSALEDEPSAAPSDRR